MTKKEWETVEDASHSLTQRMRVPGGWLYRNRTWSSTDGLCVCMVFVPRTSEGNDQ